MTTKTARTTLNLRIKPEDRNLIDCAAQIQGKNRTDFILDAARNAAEDTLLEQTIFRVSPDVYAQFIARLDAPPQPNQQLLKTMQMTPPWDN